MIRFHFEQRDERGEMIGYKRGDPGERPRTMSHGVLIEIGDERGALEEGDSKRKRAARELPHLREEIGEIVRATTEIEEFGLTVDTWNYKPSGRIYAFPNGPYRAKFLHEVKYEIARRLFLHLTTPGMARVETPSNLANGGDDGYVSDGAA